MARDTGRTRGPLTDKSGTSSGVTAKVADANPYRTYFLFQNLDDTITQYLNFGAAATTGGGSIAITPGSVFVMDLGGYISTDQINVIADSGAPAFTAKEGSD